jgi:SAM-dependent methyltransferase
MSAETPLAIRTLDRCLACGSARIAPLALRYEFRGRFPVARCRDCGIRFLRVQPVGDSLAALYAGSYFERDYRCGRSGTAYDDEAAFREENAALLDAFASLGPGRRLVEVGCAGGWLLKAATERGWTARGVELSGAAVARARALGLDVFHGTLEDASLAAASFDVAYLGDVLEHVPDCRATLAEVARALAPGGHLYLRGPITTHSLARRVALAAYGLVGREIVLREPPYHLWEFTPGPLTRLAHAAGLEVVRLTQSKIPPGRAHGAKSPLQRAAMAAIDTLNLPITRAFNVLGDRVVMIARKRG